MRYGVTGFLEADVELLCISRPCSRQRQQHARITPRQTLHRQRPADDSHHGAVQRQPLTLALAGRSPVSQPDSVILDQDGQAVVPGYDQTQVQRAAGVRTAPRVAGVADGLPRGIEKYLARQRG
jgi:hypothetical protein